MYTARVKSVGLILSGGEAKVESDLKAEVVEVAFKSDNRNYIRNLELLCKENDYPCVTTAEVAPRVVTFKGLSPTPAAQAKVDAKAAMKAANKGK